MFMFWLDIDIEQKQRNTKTKKRRNILGLVTWRRLWYVALWRVVIQLNYLIKTGYDLRHTVTSGRDKRSLDFWIIGLFPNLGSRY